MYLSMWGEADHHLGALLGCVYAADAAAEDGKDPVFAEWLAGVATGLRSLRSLDALTPPSPRNWPASRITAAVTAAEIIEARGLPGHWPNGGRGDLDPKLWAKATLETLRPFLDVAEGEEVAKVVDGIGAAVGSAEGAEGSLEPWTSMRGRGLSEIVLSVARLGSTMIPIDWWRSGSMAQPEVRGRVLRGVGDWSSAGDALTIAERRTIAFPAYQAVRHPKQPGLYVGNPMHVAYMPKSVTAVVSVGSVPSVALPNRVEVDIVLPWFLDGYDSAAANIQLGNDWESWRKLQKFEDIGRFITCPPMFGGREEPNRTNAVDTAAQMVLDLIAHGHVVMLLGGWSSSTVRQIWEALDEGADRRREERAIWPFKGVPQEIERAYTWLPREVPCGPGLTENDGDDDEEFDYEPPRSAGEVLRQYKELSKEIDDWEAGQRARRVEHAQLPVRTLSEAFPYKEGAHLAITTPEAAIFYGRPIGANVGRSEHQVARMMGKQPVTRADLDLLWDKLLKAKMEKNSPLVDAVLERIDHDARVLAEVELFGTK